MELNKIKIREAEFNDSDIEAIRDLVFYLMQVEEVEDIDWNVNKIINDRVLPSLKTENSKTFVAEINDKIVGFLLIEIKRDLVLSLVYISVYPEYQRKGIGKKLLEKAEEYARTKNIHILEVLIYKDSHSSRKFHEKNGFSLFGYNLRKKI